MFAELCPRDSTRLFARSILYGLYPILLVCQMSHDIKNPPPASNLGQFVENAQGEGSED